MLVKGAAGLLHCRYFKHCSDTDYGDDAKKVSTRKRLDIDSVTASVDDNNDGGYD